jgi:hypothetical protein
MHSYLSDININEEGKKARNDSICKIQFPNRI